MINLLKRFHKDESGATAIEYGLIAALISIAIIGGASAIGEDLSGKFTEISDKLKGTPAAETPE